MIDAAFVLANNNRERDMSYGYGQRRRRSSGGLKMRLIIAAVMVLFSLFTYMNMGQTNPVTGERQRVAMSADQEIAMGLQAAPEMTAQHGGLHPDPRGQQIVDAVGDRLLTALDGWLQERGKTNPFRFEFHLLRDPRTVNAFALPGGQVFITYALYSQLETEGQLAGVLGHEIGHVLSRHGAQRMAKQKLTQGLVGAAGVAGGGYDSAQMAQFVGQFINMKYGREDELESDKWGGSLDCRSGVRPPRNVRRDGYSGSFLRWQRTARNDEHASQANQPQSVYPRSLATSVSRWCA